MNAWAFWLASPGVSQMKRKRVRPILKIPPGIAAVLGQEAFQMPMDGIEPLHRVLGIRKPLRLPRRMGLPGDARRRQKASVGMLAVVHDHGSSRDGLRTASYDLGPARLPDAGEPEPAPAPVRRGADAELVPRKPGKKLPRPRARPLAFPLRPHFRQSLRWIPPLRPSFARRGGPQ